MAKRQQKKTIEDGVNLFNNSKMFKSTSEQIQVLKALIIKLKELPPEEMVIEAIQSGFDEKKVISLINNIIEFSTLADEDKEELNFITEFNIYMSNKEDLLNDYEKNLFMWYIYLFIFQGQEKYEICNKIKHVINQEQMELINNLNTYFDFDSNDENYIAQLESNTFNSIFQ